MDIFEEQQKSCKSKRKRERERLWWLQTRPKWTIFMKLKSNREMILLKQINQNKGNRHWTSQQLPIEIKRRLIEGWMDWTGLKIQFWYGNNCGDAFNWVCRIFSLSPIRCFVIDCNYLSNIEWAAKLYLPELFTIRKRKSIELDATENVEKQNTCFDEHHFCIIGIYIYS